MGDQCVRWLLSLDGEYFVSGSDDKAVRISRMPEKDRREER